MIKDKPRPREYKRYSDYQDAVEEYVRENKGDEAGVLGWESYIKIKWNYHLSNDKKIPDHLTDLVDEDVIERFEDVYDIELSNVRRQIL